MKKKLKSRTNIRVRSSFLFFPKVIEDELRWLRFAKWEEIYVDTVEFGGIWIPQKWIGD